jgi:diaminohydroxyphosphoribosylaminopyrimidine deaminase/5-amino-6-(5-phosphoribosylamino)uracil reductase
MLIALTIKNAMNEHEQWMKICIELGARGLGYTAPNPLVGSVIIHKDKIIGEGFHEKYGENHAEVNAIRSVTQPELLKESTIYVNLEPCNHFGKTPPCVDLIIEKQIPKVVIGAVDPFPEVNGGGIAKLKAAGLEVITGILEHECKNLNRRFYTFHIRQRPYIILKWAQTADGFMGTQDQQIGQALKITNKKTNQLVHLWRSQEQAIVVGKNTILMDDPQLTVRHVEGRQPIPIILGSFDEIPSDYKIQNSDPKFIPHDVNQIKNLYTFCIEKKIQSVLVEGGPTVLHEFLQSGNWDELRILTNTDLKIGNGIKAPAISSDPTEMYRVDNDKIEIYYRSQQ